MSGVNGVIRNISKRPGEFVKAGEKILDLQATDKIRLEGNLDVQYNRKVTRGMVVSDRAGGEHPGRTRRTRPTVRKSPASR